MPDPATNAASPTTPEAGGRFEETRWSLVLRAGQSEEPGAGAALESLCRAYWFPVYAWIRSRGHGPEEAKDLTQEFLAGLLRKGSLGSVKQEKGRFRTYLIRSIQYFLTDHLRTQTAAKRGGGRAVIEWDGLNPEQQYALEPATTDTPDAAFDRRWSQVLVARAFQRLEEEQAAAGRATEFAVLKEFIATPPLEGDYAAVAGPLGLSTNATAAAVRRLRLRCRELIMEEIMQTVGTRSEAEEELRSLFGK